MRPLIGFIVRYYAAMYSAFGVASPFWPMFFQSRGLTPQQLGTLLALGTLARLVAGPIIGRIADRIGNLRAVLATCTALAVVAALGLLPEQGYFLLLAIALCQAAVLAPITTISDALAINLATDTHRKTFEYGLVRGTGSAAFVVGTLFAGQMLSQNVGLSAIVWMLLRYFQAPLSGGRGSRRFDTCGNFRVSRDERCLWKLSRLAPAPSLPSRHSYLCACFWQPRNARRLRLFAGVPPA